MNKGKKTMTKQGIYVRKKKKERKAISKSSCPQRGDHGVRKVKNVRGTGGSKKEEKIS